MIVLKSFIVLIAFQGPHLVIICISLYVFHVWFFPVNETTWKLYVYFWKDVNYILTLRRNTDQQIRYLRPYGRVLHMVTE